MKQGVLPFQYEQEKSSPGMTAMAGMITYLELMHAAGLRSSVERHVGLRECGQGWTDSQARIHRRTPMDGVRTAAGWVRELQGRWLGSLG